MLPADTTPSASGDADTTAELDEQKRPRPGSMAELRAQVELLMRIRARQEGRCGARTRKGTPCQAKGRLNGRRCKLHGGMSTGARTEEGRTRIAEAQRRRWEQWRATAPPADALIAP